MPLYMKQPSGKNTIISEIWPCYFIPAIAPLILISGKLADYSKKKIIFLTEAPLLERYQGNLLSSGEFEWGMVITTPFRKEGVPCSNLVANLLMKMDGEKSLINIVDDLANTADESTKAKLLNYSIEAISILYVEGVIDSLS